MEKRLSAHLDANILLSELAHADRDLLVPDLAETEFWKGRVLEEPHEPVDTIYFPTSGIGSIIALGEGGRRIEAGLFGREGMSGTSILTGGLTSPNETIIQVAGHGLMMPAERFSAVLKESPTLRDHLLRYFQVLSVQTAQTALSNGHAKLEERLARWLLMCHDRVDGDRMTLTHEFLSVMLGVRRAGVTVGTHMLEGKGLIRALRGEIVILDREGLEDEARGSYGFPKAEYERLIGRSLRGLQ